jgi:hypothetical protein
MTGRAEPLDSRLMMFRDWIVAWRDGIQLRWRVLRFRYGLSPRRGVIDLLELGLAVAGSWWLLDAAARGLGWPAMNLALTIGGVLVVVGGGLAARRSTDVHALFVLASRSEQTALALHTHLRTGLANVAARGLLSELYEGHLTGRVGADQAGSVTGPSLLTICGEPTLVAIVSASDESLNDLIRFDGSRSNPVLGTRAAERQRYIARLRMAQGFGNRFGDEAGDNLVMTDVIRDEKGRLVVGAGVATYGQIMRTSDALIDEFALVAFLTANGRRQLHLSSRDLLRFLTWRRDVHQGEENPITQAVGRASGLGVTLVLVGQDDEGNAATYVARRSASVGTYPSAFQVVPSGMCNTRNDLSAATALPDGYLRTTALGELLEEAFDLEDASRYAREGWDEWVADTLKSYGLGDLTISFTGLAFDLLNLRCEVALVAPEFGAAVQQRMSLGWEFDPFGALTRIPLHAVAADSPEYWRQFVQAGLGALVLARARLGSGATATL